MIRSIINEVKQFTETVGALYRVNKGTHRIESIGRTDDEFELEIVVSDDMLIAHKSQVAAIIAQTAISGWFFPRIVLSKEVLEYPKEVYDFIIAHEIGHLRTLDGGTPEDRLQLIQRGEVCRYELMADASAVKEIGKASAIEGLSFLRNKVGGLAVKEIDMRINAIENM